MVELFRNCHPWDYFTRDGFDFRNQLIALVDGVRVACGTSGKVVRLASFRVDIDNTRPPSSRAFIAVLMVFFASVAFDC